MCSQRCQVGHSEIQEAGQDGSLAWSNKANVLGLSCPTTVLGCLLWKKIIGDERISHSFMRVGVSYGINSSVEQFLDSSLPFPYTEFCIFLCDKYICLCCHVYLWPWGANYTLSSTMNIGAPTPSLRKKIPWRGATENKWKGHLTLSAYNLGAYLW